MSVKNGSLNTRCRRDRCRRKQVYSAETFDGCLVGCALCFEVGSVAVENVDVGSRYVDVVKRSGGAEGINFRGDPQEWSAAIHIESLRS